ncbi:MAG: hypothetical protein AABY92_04770 [Thermodesulfobacteriota bacterium]|jgi:hypothetical protein
MHAAMVRNGFRNMTLQQLEALIRLLNHHRRFLTAIKYFQI